MYLEGYRFIYLSQMSARGNLMWTCFIILWHVVVFSWVCFFTIWLWYFSSFYLRNGTFQFKAIGCCWHFLLEKLSFNGFPIKTIEKSPVKLFLRVLTGPALWRGTSPRPLFQLFMAQQTHPTLTRYMNPGVKQRIVYLQTPPSW